MADQPKSVDSCNSTSPAGSGDGYDPRRLALALALVLSSTGAYAKGDELAISSSKEVLKSLVEQAQLKQTSTKVAFPIEKSTLTAQYGRNFENYAKNFENYAKNFENYAKNFENYGRNFENPLTALRTSEAYVAAVTGPAALPNGSPVPTDVDQLLKAMAMRGV